MNNRHIQFSVRNLLTILVFAAVVTAMAVNQSRQTSRIKSLEAENLQLENGIAKERALGYIENNQRDYDLALKNLSDQGADE